MRPFFPSSPMRMRSSASRSAAAARANTSARKSRHLAWFATRHELSDHSALVLPSP